jgi:hypothetical protein
VGLAAGDTFTCAMSSSGNVYCWGGNNNGQLGVNSTTLSNIPVEVKGLLGSGNLSSVTGITAGSLHVCAISDGVAYCWGDNSNGQLGNNTTTEENVPVQVVGVGGVGELPTEIGLTAGQFHTCSLSSTGTAYCWGANADGQLGNNTVTEEHAPVEVVGVGGTGDLANIVSLTAGQLHSCGLSTTGNVYCWGDNVDGGLGDNSTTTSKTPVEVVGVGGSGVLSGI